MFIDGVKYEPVVTEVKFYYMHDNHSFSQLHGASLDEILEGADNIEEPSSYGTLCPVIAKSGDKELRRVGCHVYSRGDDKSDWISGKEQWRKEVEADMQIMALLSA